MNIGYFADGPWAHRALEKIVEKSNFKIIFIVPRFDKQDHILQQWAEKLDVPFLPLKDVNSKEGISVLEKYDADINVSMSYNQILKKEIIDLSPLGFINCHAGKLPFYRGRNILNWSLINDEKDFGVTVHYVDEGVDTGDIILQKVTSITDEDDYSTLLSRAINICADLLIEALYMIDAGNVKRTKQKDIHPVGSYFGCRVEGDEYIDWNWTSRRIFNFIRAITTPGPCARTIINDCDIKVKRAELIDESVGYIGTVGEVIGVTHEGIIVKTGDSIIRLVDIELTTVVSKIKVGDRFGLNIYSAFIDLKDRISKLELIVGESKC